MKEKIINLVGILGFYAIVIGMVLLVNARFSYLKSVNELNNTSIVALNN